MDIQPFIIIPCGQEEPNLRSGLYFRFVFPRALLQCKRFYTTPLLFWQGQLLKDSSKPCKGPRTERL